MRTLLCNLMVAMVLVPAVFGWCCHPCVADAGCSSALEISRHTCCCQHSGHDDEQRPAPDHSRSDCKGICSYVLTSKLKVEPPSRQLALYVLPLESRQATDQFLAATYFAAREEIANSMVPSLRLHVINQIWLI
jgi:hypothetical protein